MTDSCSTPIEAESEDLTENFYIRLFWAFFLNCPPFSASKGRWVTSTLEARQYQIRPARVKLTAVQTGMQNCSASITMASPPGGHLFLQQIGHLRHRFFLNLRPEHDPLRQPGIAMSELE